MLSCSTLFGAGVVALAEASNTQYSDALADLKMDTSFNVSQWPEITSYRTLELITIAESVKRELFVYVYQPAAPSFPYRATSIRLSFDFDENFEYTDVNDYSLEYINHNGVFYKYKVSGFTVSTESLHKYVVVQLARPYIANYDQAADLDNTISAVPFKVGRCFSITTEDNQTVISATQVDIVIVVDKVCGFVRYNNAAVFGAVNAGMDRHFVAFKSDRQIDELYRAKVTYISQYAHKEWVNSSLQWQYAAPENKTAQIYEFNTSSFTYLDWTGQREAATASWSCLERSNVFVNGVEGTEATLFSLGNLNTVATNSFSSQERQRLLQMEWVISYDYTLYYDNNVVVDAIDPSKSRRTITSDVTILELEFVTDGVRYNLGVVDNKQSGSSTASNNSKVRVKSSSGADITDTLKQVLRVGGILLLCVVLLPLIIRVLRLIFKPIGRAVRKKHNKEV